MNSEPCKCGASDCPRCFPGSFDACPECGGTGAVEDERGIDMMCSVCFGRTKQDDLDDLAERKWEEQRESRLMNEEW